MSESLNLNPPPSTRRMERSETFEPTDSIQLHNGHWRAPGEVVGMTWDEAIRADYNIVDARRPESWVKPPDRPCPISGTVDHYFPPVKMWKLQDGSDLEWEEVFMLAKLFPGSAYVVADSKGIFLEGEERVLETYFDNPEALKEQMCAKLQGRMDAHTEESQKIERKLINLRAARQSVMESFRELCPPPAPPPPPFVPYPAPSQPPPFFPPPAVMRGQLLQSWLESQTMPESDWLTVGRRARKSCRSNALGHQYSFEETEKVSDPPSA